MMEMTKHTQNDPQSQEKENVTQENSRHMEKIGVVQLADKIAHQG